LKILKKADKGMDQGKAIVLMILLLFLSFLIPHTTGVLIENAFIKSWENYGFLPDQTREWWDNGIRSRSVAIAWKAKGFEPVEASSWKTMKIPPAEAKEWKQGGFKLAEAMEWRRCAFAPNKANEWRSIGFSLGDAMTWRKHAFEPDEAGKWRSGGYSPMRAAEERR
jgi:hypothetical protein